MLTNINTARSYTNTNLTYLNLYDISWINTFNERMSRELNLRVATGLPYHYFSEILPNNNHFLYQHWNAASKQRATLMTEPPNACIHLDYTKHTIIM